jgi:hypothetical protein
VAVGRWWASRQHAIIDRVTLYALGAMGLWTVARASFVWISGGGAS